jgi:predicted RNA-binding Zn-ribbon protein involved in translation (DUF1610 family)
MAFDRSPVTTNLPLHCPQCGGAVTIRLSDWGKDDRLRHALWTCPHCGREVAGKFQGALTSVRAGH